MSILIKGMEMPKNCFGCHLFKLDDHDLWCIANHYAGCCRALSKYIDENKFVNERHPDCPLIEVPTPHGRLGDLDALYEEISNGNKAYNGIEGYDGEYPNIANVDDCLETIKYAETVIGAEGETE